MARELLYFLVIPSNARNLQFAKESAWPSNVQLRTSGPSPTLAELLYRNRRRSISRLKLSHQGCRNILAAFEVLH